MQLLFLNKVIEANVFKTELLKEPELKITIPCFIKPD